MDHPETNSTKTADEPLHVDSVDPNGVSLSHASIVLEDGLDEQVRFQGVIAIDVPREVMARFSGTLILNELPERQPEIMQVRGGQFRNDDDE